MAFLRPSPLLTQVQMCSLSQVPGSKVTSTGPVAGKTQGQRRFLWPGAVIPTWPALISWAKSGSQASAWW